MQVTERIPEIFAAKLLKGKQPPWQQVTTADASSISLLEWAMRDSLAAGKQDDILARIAKLEAEDSDDANLA